MPDVELSHLDLLQRVLVTTDGTVTDMLMAAFCEPIDLVKISVTVGASESPVPALEVAAGDTVMHRQIVLRGGLTGTPYVYAEVLIAADRLSPALRQDLIEGRTPLGQLWLSHRLETWKERPQVREVRAGGIGSHFGVSADARLIHRDYRTFAGGAPVYHVHEWFPRRYAVAPPA